MLTSLDAAYAFTRDTPRDRTPQDAHWKLNRAYLDLIFAWGYAQTGNEVRSKELLEAARAALPQFDAVHQTVLSAFELRIREHNASPWTRLDVDLAHLESIERYRVLRLFETLAILSRVEFVDAIGGFWREGEAHTAVPLLEDAVTPVLIADGEGRVDDVRSGVEALLATPWVLGAVLLGPCRRVDRDVQLLNRLARWSETPPVEVAVALEALGSTVPTDLQLDQLGPHRIARVQSARKYIGARALSGHTAAAEALAAQAWRVASDSFNTNESFSLLALGVCETIVLSVLRHELALGNRSLLEPIDPSLKPPPPPAPSPEEAKEPLVLCVRMLAFSLRDAAALPGSSEQGFRQYCDELLDLVDAPLDNASPAPDTSTRSERIESVKSWATELEALLEAPDFGDAELAIRARPIVSAVLALVADLEAKDPSTLTRGRVVDALWRVEGCLRSCVVERPTMTRSLFERVAKAREALHDSLMLELTHDSNERSWVELPLEALVESISENIGDAQRDISSLPDEWDPAFVASARDCVTLVSALIPDLRD